MIGHGKACSSHCCKVEVSRQFAYDLTTFLRLLHVMSSRMSVVVLIVLLWKILSRHQLQKKETTKENTSVKIFQSKLQKAINANLLEYFDSNFQCIL